MTTKIFAAFSFCIALVGCGGGGGGGESSNPPSPSLTLSTTSLTFDAATATTASWPGARSVTASVNGFQGGNLFIRIAVNGSAVQSVSSVTITGPNSGQAFVFPASPSALGPGVHTSTITVTACTTDASCTSGIIGTPQTINVTYTVNDFSVGTLIDFIIGDEPDAPNLNHAIALSAYPTTTWTATASAPWVSVPATGTASGRTLLNVSLVLSQLDAMDTGNYTASVVVTPSGRPPITVPVNLRILRMLNRVAPYVALANTSQEVIIRGSFGNRAINGVRFGSVDASSFRSINATEVRATHPRLAPGRYEVHVLDNTTLNRPKAELVVVELPMYAASETAFVGSTDRQALDALFDAERGALLIAMAHPSTGAASEVLRYTMSNGNWTLSAHQNLPGVSSIALSTDGRTLVTSTLPQLGGTRGMSLLDPTTLSVSSSTYIQIADGGGLAVANNDYAMYSAPAGLNRYALDIRVESTISSSQSFGQARASLDGSIVLLGRGGGALVFQPNPFSVTSTTDSITPFTSSIDRTGSRYVLMDPAKTYAYNGSHARLGSVPGASPGGLVLVAPNGQRVYSVSTGSAQSQLRTFDLTGQAVAGDLSEIGVASTLPTSVGSIQRLAITPDSRTLFVVGNNGLATQPLP